jgi:hypothetical protein
MYTYNVYVVNIHYYGGRMVRTQIYLTDKEKKGLENAALSQGVSQSELIRHAIDELLLKSEQTNKTLIVREVAGIWAERNDLPDIRELRTGWRKRPKR